jgi:hypothetical protein
MLSGQTTTLDSGFSGHRTVSAQVSRWEISGYIAPTAFTEHLTGILIRSLQIHLCTAWAIAIPILTH